MSAHVRVLAYFTPFYEVAAVVRRLFDLYFFASANTRNLTFGVFGHNAVYAAVERKGVYGNTL